MKVRFTNEAFYAAHGKTPAGRGGWAFGERYNTPADQLIWSPAHMTLAEAKRWLAGHLKQTGAQGHVTIYIQP